MEKVQTCFQGFKHCLMWETIFDQMQTSVLNNKSTILNTTCHICWTIFVHMSVYLIPEFVGQIMAVRLFMGAATGPCEGGSGHCGKEVSGESDSSPALCWSNPGPSAANSSTSLTGCRRWWAWQEEAPTVPSRWMASICGTQSGELWGGVGLLGLRTLERESCQVLSVPLLYCCSSASLFSVESSAASISPLLLWQWGSKRRKFHQSFSHKSVAFPSFFSPPVFPLILSPSSTLP